MVKLHLALLLVIYHVYGFIITIKIKALALYVQYVVTYHGYIYSATYTLTKMHSNSNIIVNIIHSIIRSSIVNTTSVSIKLKCGY